MIVLIDNGHGCNTMGKQSPDGRLREWSYTREIAARVVEGLKGIGIDARRIVTEDTDVSLSERVRRVNAVCSKVGARNVILISIHVNAAGGGASWRTARGWTVWVCKTASSRSKLLAQDLYNEALIRNLKGNRCVHPRHYWEGDFYILRKTQCAAVLTENLFQDNREDVAYLLTDEGKDAIVSLHIDGIKKFLQKC